MRYIILHQAIYHLHRMINRLHQVIYYLNRVIYGLHQATYCLQWEIYCFHQVIYHLQRVIYHFHPTKYQYSLVINCFCPANYCTVAVKLYIASDGNLSFCQHVTSPTYKVDSPMSWISSPMLICQFATFQNALFKKVWNVVTNCQRNKMSPLI